MDVYGSSYHDYSGSSYMNDLNMTRGYGEDGSYMLSTPRSSESGSSRNSRLQGLSFDAERRVSHESKPRLSKDQQEILERHFQQHPKPSTLTKKDFSDKLGIPLDKINNWFQNRRAKVKQEAKKSQNAHMVHYATQMARAQLTSEPPYAEHTFYPHVVEAPARTLMAPGGLHIQVPTESSEPLVNSSIDHFGHTFDMPYAPFSQAVVEPTFDDSPEAFNNFFGLEDSFHTYHSNFDQHALADFGKQFSPAFETTDAFTHSARNLEAYGSSTSVSALTQSSRDDNSLYLKMSYEDQAPALTSRCNSNVPSMISTGTGAFINSTPQSYIKEEFQLENERDTENQAVSIPHQLFVPENRADLPHRPAIDRTMTENTAIGDDLKSTGPEPSLPNQPVTLATSRHELPICNSQKDQGSQPRQQNNNEPSGSSVAAVIKAEPSTDSVELKSPSSGLAARRRNRPAALGSGTMRSASFTNFNAPASPKPAGPDPQLRRIKSSSVINGRIHKSAPSSGQRSPLGVNFPDGTVSPTIARQMSLQSLDAVAADSAHRDHDSVPMTPLSPLETLQSTPHSTHYQPGRPYSTIIESDMEQPEGSWTNAPGATVVMSAPFWGYNIPQGVTAPNYVSPPRTPMEFASQQGPPHHNGFAFSPVGPAPMTDSFPSWHQVLQPHPNQNLPFAVPYGYPQPGPIPSGISFPGAPQQYHSMVVAQPLMDGNGPQPTNRGPGASSEDIAVAGMIAAQQQHYRNQSAPMLSSASTMPIVSSAAHAPHYQNFNPGFQSMPLPRHPVPPNYYSNGQPQSHSTDQPQLQPQSYLHAQPHNGPSQLYSHGQPHALAYPPPPPYPQYHAEHSLPSSLHFDAPARSPTAPPNARSNSIMSAPMSAMSMSPTPGPCRTSTPCIGGLTLGSPTSGGAIGGGMNMLSSTPTKSSASPELMIHEYSPREPADPSRLPPKIRTTTPRTYSFQHTGPEAFSASP